MLILSSFCWKHPGLQKRAITWRYNHLEPLRNLGRIPKKAAEYLSRATRVGFSAEQESQRLGFSDCGSFPPNLKVAKELAYLTKKQQKYVEGPTFKLLDLCFLTFMA